MRNYELRGAQVDLLIDRRDGIANLCEMKYSKVEYAIEKDEAVRIRNRVEAFRKVIGENKDDSCYNHYGQRTEAQYVLE